MRDIIKQILREEFNFDIVANTIKDNAQLIRDLLIGMYPFAKDIINEHYNDEHGQPFAELRRLIYDIDTHVLTGPKVIDSSLMHLDDSDVKVRQDRYNDYVNGKSKKYFRDNESDPREIDFNTLAPVTIVSDGDEYDGGKYEVIDGIHRVFLAQMNNKPLKAYIWVKAQNNHPNAKKIKELFITNA